MATRQTDLQRILSRSDPLLNFKWVTEESLFGLPGNYLESVDVPFNNISVREGQYVGASFIYFPGTNNTSSVGITLYEDSEGSTVRWLESWKSAIVDFKTGLHNLPIEYKRNLKVYMLDTMGEKVTTVYLEGIFPEATGNISLGYNESGRVIITQTFSCDNCRFDFHKRIRYEFK